MFQRNPDIVLQAQSTIDLANSGDLAAADTLFPSACGAALWREPAARGGRYYVATRPADPRDRKIMTKSAWSRNRNP